MVTHFREEEIEEFRQCFFYFARPDSEGNDKTPVLTLNSLKLALRSLGCVPTLDEVKRHLNNHKGKVTLPEFLEILHKQQKSEDIPRDVFNGFYHHDARMSGTLPVRDVHWMLQNFGERLSDDEVDQLFREGGAVIGGNFNYREFVKNFCGSLPPPMPAATNKKPPKSNGYGNGIPPPDY